MNSKFFLLSFLVAANTFSPGSSQASCYSAYSEASRGSVSCSKDDDYEHCFSTGVLMVSGIPVLSTLAPLGTTLYAVESPRMSTNNTRVNNRRDKRKVLELIIESRNSNHQPETLVELQAELTVLGVEVSIDDLKLFINEAEAQDAFCRDGKLMSYGKVRNLIKQHSK